MEESGRRSSGGRRPEAEREHGVKGANGKRKLEHEVKNNVEGGEIGKQAGQPSPKKVRLESELIDPSYTQRPGITTDPCINAMDEIPTASITSKLSLSERMTGGEAIVDNEASSIQQTAQEESPTKKKWKPRSGKIDIIHGISRDIHLLHHFISFLNLPSLISLYTISKPFHFYLNTSYTAAVLSSVRTWAPGAETIYPWRCYKTLCIKDPAQRRKLRLQNLPASEMKRKWLELRDVPSLNWLQMVVYREGVCQDMLIVMRGQGLLCPPGTLEAVKKMWFLMDLPLNAQRIALIQNRKYVTNDNLQHFTMFLLKVDMLLTDPMAPSHPMAHPNTRVYPPKDRGHSPSGIGLRKLVLAERQMTPLWRIIRGWTPDPLELARPMTRLDMLRLWVRHKYKPDESLPEATRKQDIMGIPWWEVGTAGLERTGVTFADTMKDVKVDADNARPKAQPSANRTAATHPKIMPPSTESLYGSQIDELTQHRNQAHIAYSGEHKLDPSVFTRGIKRDPLLGPDELVMREAVRRELSYHKEWMKWMAWGFCGIDGSDWEVLNEHEWLEVLRGRKHGWNVPKSNSASMNELLGMDRGLMKGPLSKDGNEAHEGDGQNLGHGENSATEQTSSQA